MMNNKMIHLCFILSISLILFGCTEDNTETVTIAITKTNDNYSSWIENNGTNVSYVELYGLPVDSAIIKLESCDGLLVTGGDDIYPGYYGKADDTTKCGNIDHYRDSLELALIDYALVNKQPIFGVCRGLQILNVAMGGTLIIDIPTDYDTLVIHRQDDWQHCFHEVALDTLSFLYMLSHTAHSTVNSNHHQGIDELGEGLKISSYANDSLPESIEWLNPEGKGFLLAVQWHPERMDILHPLSRNPAIAFIHAAAEYQKKAKAR